MSMNKLHYKEWKVEYMGQEIKVTNWWNWDGESSADLFINDKHVDKYDEKLANPNISVLNANKYSEEIQTLKVYFAGVFKIKVLIKVNGENVFQDKLNIIDKLLNKVFPKD